MAQSQRPEAATRKAIFQLNGLKTAVAGRLLSMQHNPEWRWWRRHCRKPKLSWRNKSKAPPPRKTGLFENKERDLLPVGCTAKTHFNEGVWLEWISNGRSPSYVSVWVAAYAYQSISAFLQAAGIPVLQRAYVLLSMEDLETIRRAVWYRASFYSAWGVFPKLSRSSVAKKNTACVSRAVGMSFFSAEKTNIVHHVFAVLSCWTYASALPLTVFMQLKAPSSF